MGVECSVSMSVVHLNGSCTVELVLKDWMKDFAGGGEEIQPALAKKSSKLNQTRLEFPHYDPLSICMEIIGAFSGLRTAPRWRVQGVGGGAYLRDTIRKPPELCRKNPEIQWEIH